MSELLIFDYHEEFVTRCSGDFYLVTLPAEWKEMSSE